jgi:hypothetical protein
MFKGIQVCANIPGAFSLYSSILWIYYIGHSMSKGFIIRYLNPDCSVAGSWEPLVKCAKSSYRDGYTYGSPDSIDSFIFFYCR